MKDNYKRRRDDNNLYENGKVIWLSDDSYNMDNGNSIIICRENKDTIVIQFNLNERKLFGQRSIRFRNSGSRYDPYNIVFMDNYHELCNYIDDNQIHIEEYIYSLNKR